MRIRMDLSYNGMGFHGWAIQPGLRTVQGELEAALSMVLREPITLTVAGRTDAGVHAADQVAHFDVNDDAWVALPGRSTREPGSLLSAKLMRSRRAVRTGRRGIRMLLSRRRVGCQMILMRGFRRYGAATRIGSPTGRRTGIRGDAMFCGLIRRLIWAQ